MIRSSAGAGKIKDESTEYLQTHVGLNVESDIGDLIVGVQYTRPRIGDLCSGTNPDRPVRDARPGVVLATEGMV
jgi:hypothetical protein